MGTVSRLIRSTPTPMRNVLWKIIPFQYRYTNTYKRTLDVLLKTERLSSKQLRVFQLFFLRKTLLDAYVHVPYYRSLFDKIGFHPNDFRTFDDLDAIPILTKDDVRNYHNELISDRTPTRPVHFSTSGSTGTPLTILGTEAMYHVEAAHVQRAYLSHGAQLYDGKSVWIRRYSPGEGDPIYKWDRELHRLYLSPFHLSEKTVQEYVSLINRSRAKTISAYPSSLYILARLMRDTKLRLHHIKALHVASETLLPQWKIEIEQVFEVPVRAHYGQIERVSFAFQCSHSNNYHDALEYGYTEYVKDYNSNLYRVIGTSFMNPVMPLIRYDTGDLARLGTDPYPCACGRGLPRMVSYYEGRSDDILVSDDGRYIPPVNFYTMMYKMGFVRMFSIVQHSTKNIEVQIVPDGEVDYELITREMQKRLGNLSIDIVTVDEIDRSHKTGKVRCIQNLSGTSL